MNDKMKRRLKAINRSEGGKKGERGSDQSNKIMRTVIMQ